MKKLNVALLGMATLCSLNSCKESMSEMVNDQTETTMYKCLCENAENDSASSNGTALKGVSVLEKDQWPNGCTLQYHIYGDQATSEKNNLLKWCCYNWMAHANINLQDITDTDVLHNYNFIVNFEYKAPSYDSNGYALTYAGGSNRVGKASNMIYWVKFYNTNDDDTESLTRVFFHEIGHVLGLYHEHQHPQSTIIESNYKNSPNFADMYQKYQADKVKYGDFTKKSVMAYDIYAINTTDNSGIWATNKPTAKDYSYLESIYPFGDTCRIWQLTTAEGANFFTTDIDEKSSLNTPEHLVGPVCRLLTKQGTGMKPVYRQYLKQYGTEYWKLTRNPSSYWSQTKLVGYVYTSKVAGTVPLYQFIPKVNSADCGKKFIYGTDYNELSKNYTFSEFVGWVYPAMGRHYIKGSYYDGTTQDFYADGYYD